MAAILFCFTVGIFIARPSPFLQIGGEACECPTAPFTKPGVYTLASYRGGNRVRGTGRSARGRGGIGVGGRNEDGNRVGGGNGNVNGDGDGDGAGAGTAKEVEVNEEARYRNGDADVNGEGNEDGAREGGGEAKKRKKPRDSCRRNQALLFRTRHHL